MSEREGESEVAGWMRQGKKREMGEKKKRGGVVGGHGWWEGGEA